MNFSLFRSRSVGCLPRSIATGSFLSRRVVALLAAVALSGAARADLLVLQPGGSGKGPGVIQRFDEATGLRLSTFGEINEGMRGMCLAANGQLLVTANTLGQCDLYRFDQSGRFLGAVAESASVELTAIAATADGALFGLVLENGVSPARYRLVRIARDGTVADLTVPDAAELSAPRALAVGLDGHLYVADQVRGVLRFDGRSGNFLGVFVPPGRGGLQDPARLAFGADGRLYVASAFDHSVRRFHAGTGAFEDVFVAAGSGGLRQPGGLAFGPDGHLYISSRDTHQVLRYDGATGAFMNVFATYPDLRGPTWLVFTPAKGVATASGLAQR